MKLGIDLGGTNIAAGIVDDNFNIIKKLSVKTKLPRSPKEIIEDMALLAKNLLAQASVKMSDIEWIGVGAPGSVIQSTGVIDYSNNLEFHDVPIKAMLEKLLNKTVYVENDANAAAYGEYIAGSAKGAKISIMVTLGTGVGGGIVINNKIYVGANDAGGELGHSVIILDGRECTCGRKGCLESYASATGLVVTTKEFMLKHKNSIMWELCDGDIQKAGGRTAFDAMRKGDKVATDVVDLYIKQLACGITNIINTFQPDILCIGGGISHEKEYLLTPLKEIISKEVYSRNSDKNTEIVIATLGNDAGIIGAAMLGNAR
ncbi:MAG: ROK family protein [Oscillospiraceae bacterium]